MLSLFIFSLLFVLPFVVLPFGSSFFESPKVIIGEIIIELAIFLALITGKLKLPQKNLKLAVLALFALTLVHLTVSGFNIEYFWGNSYRLQGVFLFWHLILLFVLSSSHKFQFPTFIYSLILGALSIEVVIMGQNQAGRAIGSLGEPNALAATALFFLPPALLAKGKLFFKIPPLVLVVFIIFLSGSKSGFLALFLLAGYIFLVKIMKFSLSKALIVSLILLGSSLVLPFTEDASWFEYRGEIWQTALVAGLKQPLIGNGFGNIEDTLRKTSVELGNNIQYQIIDSSHNILLDFWVQGGFLALGLLCYLIGIFLWRAKNNMILTASFLVIFTIMLFNPVSIVNLIAFWWILGQGVTK